MKNYLNDNIKNIFENLNELNCDGIIDILNKSNENYEKILKNNKKEINYDNFVEEVDQLIEENLNIIEDNQFEEEILQFLSDWIIYHFLYKILLEYKKNYAEAFENLKKAFYAFQEFYMNFNKPELSKIFKNYIKLLNNLTLLFNDSNSYYKYISDYGAILMSFFSKFQNYNDETENTKYAVFFSIVCLIKTYFILKNFRNSLPLVKWCETQKIISNNNDNKNISSSELCNYFYYNGRLSLYELNIITAHEKLTKAFEICICSKNSKKNFFNNASVLYEYLIPLNLFLGFIPNYEYIKKYKLNKNYLTLIDSFRNGNIILFEKSLDNLEDRIIQLGTFLILGKLKPYVYRNLIKILYNIKYDDIKNDKNIEIRNSLGKKPFILEIEIILEVINKLYVNDDKKFTIDDLVLEILGVLSKKIIAGYIHHVNKVIVFGKNPFPNLKENLINNYDKII